MYLFCWDFLCKTVELGVKFMHVFVYDLYKKQIMASAKKN